jgi:hypothetical protein
MFKVIRLTLLSILLVSVGVSFGQCPEPNQVLKPDYREGWGDNSQSKTGSLRPGDTYEMNFIAQSGLKYRITLLSGTGPFTDENIDFQLVGSEVNKVEENGKSTYKRQEVVYFDSRNQPEGEKMTFSTPKTRKLTLKMKLNGVDDTKLVQCVIVFVESKRELQVGF